MHVYIVLIWWFKQSKHVEKSVPFYDPLKMLKLKTLTFDGIIKKDNVNTIIMLVYNVKLYMLHSLISALILET